MGRQGAIFVGHMSHALHIHLLNQVFYLLTNCILDGHGSRIVYFCVQTSRKSTLVTYVTLEACHFQGFRVS